MNRFKRLRWVWVLALIALSVSAHAARVRYDRTAPGKLFSDVVLDLEYSIGRHNFAVVGHNEIGQAVRRRGHPHFGDAAIVHFCNLEYAREVMNINRSLILYMPCRVAVYKNKGVVHAASLLLPDETRYKRFNTLAKKINHQIREIIDAAVAPNAAPEPSASNANGSAP